MSDRAPDGAEKTSLRIFLNYRREDTADAAGRLYDALAARFGEGHVFMDIDSIDPGVDFGEVVAEALASSDVLLAVIGRHWLTITDSEGRRRLDNPDDFVRIELEQALKAGVRVVPVLVQGVEMPSSDRLPEGLKPLARRNALEMTHARWSYDLTRLVAALLKYESHHAKQAAVSAQPAAEIEPAAADGEIEPAAADGEIEPAAAEGEIEPAAAHAEIEPRAVHAIKPAEARPPSNSLTRITSGPEWKLIAGALAAVVVVVLAVIAITAGGGGKAHAGTPPGGSTTGTTDTGTASAPNTGTVAQTRSSADGVPFTILYPSAWTVAHQGGEVVDFSLRDASGEDISYIEIAEWPVAQARSQLSGENEHYTETSERHSGIDMTVFDWENNGDSSGLNSNSGHQRFYGFTYKGQPWNILCGWGTTGTVTAEQAGAAEQACTAAVSSIEPA